MQTELFCPNNHSKWIVEYRPINTDLRAELKCVIDNYYSQLFDFDSIRNIEQVDEVEVNSNNFRITVEKNGYWNRYLLRRFPVNRVTNNILATYEIAEYLKSGGLKVPTVILSKNNEKLVWQNGVAWSLFEFLSDTHYRGTVDELKSAGREIGKLNRLLDIIPNKEQIRTLVVFPENYTDARKYSEEIWFDIFDKANDKKDEFSEKLLSMKPLIMGYVNQNVSDLYAHLPKQLVHFDLHPHNLLADGEKIVAILDFDSVRYLEKIRTVAFAVHRLVRQCILFNHLPMAEVRKLSDIFIGEYLREDTLTQEEIVSIPHFIRNEALCRFSYVTKNVYRNGSKWECDFNKQILSLAESVYF